MRACVKKLMAFYLNYLPHKYWSVGFLSTVFIINFIFEGSKFFFFTIVTKWVSAALFLSLLAFRLAASVIDTTAKKYSNYVKNETSQLLNIILCGKKTTFSSIITHSWRKIPYTSTWIVLPSFFHAYTRLRYTFFFFFFKYNIIYNSVIAIRQ